VGWRFVLVQNLPVYPKFCSFPSHTSKQFRQDFNVILLFTVWPMGTHSAITIAWISKKTINTSLNFERFLRALFGLGDNVDFHCIECRLVSGSYVNTQVSSQVIIEFNKSGSFSMRCKRSKHSSLRRSFCSSDSSFGTICAQNFLMFNSSLRICRTIFLSKLTSSATVRTPNLRSFRITARTFPVLSSVTAVRGRHRRSSTFKLSLLSKIVCAIQTRVHETCNLDRKPQSITEKFPSRISSV